MDDKELFKGILNSVPYPILFVDLNHIIRFMNKAAEYHYCTERGLEPLLGQSLFNCHRQEKSHEIIRKTVEGFKTDAKEILLHVNDRNLRVYITPVKNENNELIGYYERFENNYQIRQ